MNNASQLACFIPMNWQDQFAWAVPPVGITLVASLILFGIWRRGVPEIERSTRKKTISRDDGVMWLFLACTVWCFTAVVQAIEPFKTGSLLPDNSSLTFLFVLFSVTNSLFFILATANLDAMTNDSGFVAKLLKNIRQNSTPYWILSALILITSVLRFAWPKAPYYKGFDVAVSLVTIFLIVWGFTKSFWKRGMPIIAVLTIPVFLVFTITQIREFLPFLLPHLSEGTLTLLRIALRASSDGMVSLIFIAVTFSWVHEKADILADELTIPIPDIPTPTLNPMGKGKQTGA